MSAENLGERKHQELLWSEVRGTAPGPIGRENWIGRRLASSGSAGVTAPAGRSGRRRRRRRSASSCAFFQPPNTRRWSKSFSVRELALVLLGDGRIGRAVVVLRRDLLAFRRIEILQVVFRQLAGAVLVDDLVDHRDRRLGEDRGGGHDDFELVGAELLHREQGLVLPGEQHVADPALRRRWWWSRGHRCRAPAHACRDRATKALRLVRHCRRAASSAQSQAAR